MAKAESLSYYLCVFMFDKLNTDAASCVLWRNEELLLGHEYKAPSVKSLIRMHRFKLVRRRLGSACSK